MFDNNKFITKGIHENITLALQLFMWNCIDALKEHVNQLDHLQVFELSKQRSDDIFYQKIEHKQEIPQYFKTYNLLPSEMIDAKVFVIDDGKYSTMMLA